MTNVQLKDRARGELPGHYRVLVLAELLNLVIHFLAVTWFGESSGIGSGLLIGGIASLLLGVLSAGFHYMYLEIARGSHVRVSDLFYCFTHHPDKVILIEIMLYLLSAAVSVPFILISEFAPLPEGSLAFMILLLFILIWLAAVFMIRLPFLPVYYLYVDHPNWDVRALLEESRGIMSGQIKKAFRLYVSFIGYALLGIASFGIAFLWIAPYIRMTVTEFYLEM